MEGFERFLIDWLKERGDERVVQLRYEYAWHDLLEATNTFV